jgi:hypothetical protein
MDWEWWDTVVDLGKGVKAEEVLSFLKSN